MRLGDGRQAGRPQGEANVRCVPGEPRDRSRRLRFRPRPVGETRLELVARIGDAYGLVLVLILVTFAVTVTLPPQGWGGRVAASAVAGLTAVIALTSSNVRARRVLVAIVAALAAVTAAALAKAVSSDGLLGAAFLVDGLLLTVAAVTILRRVVLAADVDFRTILGAISVYLILGLLFSFAYAAIDRLQSGAFFGKSLQTGDYVFFSFTTLTTTGYGNLVPAGQPGRMLSGLDMLIGQIFLVTLIAGLVSLWRPGARRRGKQAG